jgi:uncharacterized membrane protein
MTSQQQVGDYLSRFESHLRTPSRAAKEDILCEIAAHIRDSTEQHDGNVASVLMRLGEPETLAKQYSDSVLIQSASRSVSPLLLLKAALRLATKGFFGVVVLACGVVGYLIGAGFVLVGLIKPLAPAHTGLWLLNGVPVSSGALVVIPPPPAHEVLGWWCIPLALTLGTLILFVTTVTIRASLRLSPAWQARLKNGPIMSHFFL